MSLALTLDVKSLALEAMYLTVLKSHFVLKSLSSILLGVEGQALSLGSQVLGLGLVTSDLDSISGTFCSIFI